MKKLALISLTLLLLLPVSLAQDETKPTIAMLRYGGQPGSPTYVETRAISMLEHYDYISEAERATLNERQDLEGEKVNVVWGDAGWDIPTANLMVEKALDQGADILVTVTTPVTRAAVNLTLDLDDPPLVLSSSVLYPYAAGIAQASCLKPDHVIGVAVEVPLAHLMSLLLTQQPDVARIGILGSSSEISGSEGVALLAELAAENGLEASVANIVNQSDAILAIDGILSKDIEALVTTWDVLVSHNAGHITEAALDQGIPVYVPSLPLVFRGAAFSAGLLRDFEEAVIVARLLASYLAGELDPATTGLGELRGAGTGVNLDVLESLGMSATPELLEDADMIIKDGEPQMSEPYLIALMSGSTAHEVEQDLELDRALLESLQCTEEVIAEQQAALDAADE